MTISHTDDIKLFLQTSLKIRNLLAWINKFFGYKIQWIPEEKWRMEKNKLEVTLTQYDRRDSGKKYFIQLIKLKIYKLIINSK